MGTSQKAATRMTRTERFTIRAVNALPMKKGFQLQVCEAASANDPHTWHLDKPTLKSIMQFHCLSDMSELIGCPVLGSVFQDAQQGEPRSDFKGNTV